MALPLHVEPALENGGEARHSVRVPFAFVAGTSELPAGSYEVQPDESGGFLVRDTEDFIRAILPARLSQGRRLLQGAKLLFHRFGPHFVLAGVWPGLAPQ